jgi:hypothetical protein
MATESWAVLTKTRRGASQSAAVVLRLNRGEEIVVSS